MGPENLVVRSEEWERYMGTPLPSSNPPSAPATPTSPSPQVPIPRVVSQKALKLLGVNDEKPSVPTSPPSTNGFLRDSLSNNTNNNNQKTLTRSTSSTFLKGNRVAQVRKKSFLYIFKTKALEVKHRISLLGQRTKTVGSERYSLTTF
jgi:hypothetical protein